MMKDGGKVNLTDVLEFFQVRFLVVVICFHATYFVVLFFAQIIMSKRSPARQ